MLARKARIFVIAIAGVASGAAAVACVDLFHGTNFETLCQSDPDAAPCGSGPVVEAGPTDAGIVDTGVDANVYLDFCALDGGNATTNAQHACAWLGACEGPVGHNALGQCMFDALQAFDCTARPDMKVNGVVHDYWQCLALAKTCADVDLCVFPKQFDDCPANAGYNACAGNGVTRVICPGGLGKTRPAFAENCAGQGRVCFQPNPSGDSLAYCASPAAPAAGANNCVPGCHGTAISECTNDAGVATTIDVGRDCKDIGAGQCVLGFCAASGKSCGDSLACSGPSVHQCTSLRSDDVGCTRLDPSHNSNVSCTDDGGVVTSGPPWDPSYACIGNATCGIDQCSGTVLNGCFNGITYAVDCTKLGLKGCAQVANVPTGPDFMPQGMAAACVSP